MAPTDSPNGPTVVENEAKTRTPGTVQGLGTPPAVPVTAPTPSYRTPVSEVQAVDRRPGWVVFAATMTFIAAFWYALVSLTEFANSTWFVTVSGQTYNLFSSHFFWWGIFDAAIAVLAVAAAASLLRGGIFGLMMGFFGAGFSMVRWMFYIPAAPWLAFTIIALDILVIVALCLSADWFSEQTS